MAENEGQEKTEEPSSKRLQDARNKGQIPRSKELTTTLMMLVGAGGIYLMGKHLLNGIADIIISGLSIERETLFDIHALTSALSRTTQDAFVLLAPFLGLMVVVALLAPLALSGWNFSTQALNIKWEKLNPITGMGKLLSWQGLVELLKALVKFLLVGSVGVTLLWSQVDNILQLGKEPLETGLPHLAHLLMWAFLVMSTTLIVIALADVPFQLWNHTRQLKMSRQDIKDEHKESEGSPEIKGRLRQMQREVARRRMMQEVPTADVIVTNPTHYAVAIRYDQKTMRAPKVVAKGAELIAAQIRDVGAANNVPIVSAPVLARALYFNTEMGDEIPQGLYLAVAQLLAYIYQLNNYNPGQNEPPIIPDFPIPNDFKRD